MLGAVAIVLVLSAVGAWWYRLQADLSSPAAAVAAAFVSAVANHQLDEAFALCNPRKLSRHQLTVMHRNHRVVFTASERAITYAEINEPNAQVLVQYTVASVRHRVEIDLVLRDRWMIEEVILLSH